MHQVCSVNVVMQFARVARAVDFVYCYSILESNKRLDSASASSNPPYQAAHTTSSIATGLTKDSGLVTAELNTFFPFDPYRLPKSSVFIKDVYRDWSSVAIDNESDDEEESDGEEFDEAEGAGGLLSAAPEVSSNYLVIPKSKKGLGPSRDGFAGEGDDTGVINESLEQMSISPAYRGQRGIALGALALSVPMS